MSRLSAVFDSNVSAPTVPEWIDRELVAMEPRHFLRFPRGGPWEIWIELNPKWRPMKGDRWHTDAQCWVRRLQAYTQEDGTFAPIDCRLLVGLELADTWANRRFYEDNVEAPEAAREAALSATTRTLANDAYKYYKNYANPTVGAGHNRPGWRQGVV